jgi:hypothetical protein
MSLGAAYGLSPASLRSLEQFRAAQRPAAEPAAEELELSTNLRDDEGDNGLLTGGRIDLRL